jgi:hypothetical protein
MFGWLGAYLERRRRRKARAAKMASDSAQMAAMLQANAPQRGRRRKGFWAKLFGTGQRTSMPLPPPAAPPRPGALVKSRVAGSDRAGEGGSPSRERGSSTRLAFSSRVPCLRASLGYGASCLV